MGKGQRRFRTLHPRISNINNIGYIKVNPAKRQMAKLCLNSPWGKFADLVPPSKVNIVSVAEFTTAYARLKMYDYFQTLWRIV